MIYLFFFYNDLSQATQDSKTYHKQSVVVNSCMAGRIFAVSVMMMIMIIITIIIIVIKINL